MISSGRPIAGNDEINNEDKVNMSYEYKSQNLGVGKSTVLIDIQKYFITYLWRVYLLTILLLIILFSIFPTVNVIAG